MLVAYITPIMAIWYYVYPAVMSQQVNLIFVHLLYVANQIISDSYTGI